MPHRGSGKAIGRVGREGPGRSSSTCLPGLVSKVEIGRKVASFSSPSRHLTPALDRPVPSSRQLAFADGKVLTP